MKILSFLRLTNGDGKLSLTYLFIILSGVMYALHPDAVTAATVAAAVANYGVFKKLLPARAADAAEVRVHDLAKTKVSADVEKLHEAVQKLGTAVQVLATPERQAAAQKMTGQAPKIPIVPTRL